jgi:hypothetical protein
MKSVALNGLMPIWAALVLLVGSGCETGLDPRYIITRAIDRHDPYYKQAQARWDALNASPGPFQVQCLSVPRPEGQNWQLSSFTLPSSNHMWFVQQLAGQHHDAFAHVDIFSLNRTFATAQEYRQWRCDHGPKGNKQNFVLDYSVQSDSRYGQFCVRSFEDMETHRITTFSHTILRHRTWAYCFLLPELPGKEVKISYFEWGLPPDVATALPADGEAFIAGVQINRISGR